MYNTQIICKLFYFIFFKIILWFGQESDSCGGLLGGHVFFYDYTLPSHLLVIKQHMIQKYKDDKFDKAAFFIKV